MLFSSTRSFVKVLISLLIALLTCSMQAIGHERVNKRGDLINTYYEMADSCYNTNNYPDAIMYVNKGTSEIKSVRKYKEQYYDLKMIEVLSYMNLNDFNSAIYILSELERLKLTPWHQAKIYLNYFHCYFEIEEWAQAISNAENCLNIVEGWDDVTDIILHLKQGLAKSYARSGQYDIANDNYYSALDYAKEFGSKESYIRCCSEIYSEFYNVWYSTLVIDVINELLKFHQENNWIDEDYCALLMQLGVNYQQLGNFQAAYDAYKQALNEYLSLSEKKYNPDYCLEGELLSAIAGTLSRLHNYSEAYDYVDKAEKAFAEHSDYLYQQEKDQLQFLKAIMLIDENVKLAEAAAILKQLINNAESKRVNQSWLAVVYYNLGLALNNINRDEALDAFNSSSQLMSKYLGTGVLYAKVLNQIAAIYNNKEEGAVAIQYYESALEIYRKYSTVDNFSMIQCLCNAARCAFNYGEIGRAISWAEEARQIQNTNSIGYVDYSAWSVLLDAYNKVRNKDAYNRIYEEYRAITNNGLYELDFVQRELNKLCYSGKIEEAIEYIETIEALHEIPDYLKKNNFYIERFIEPEHTYRFNRCMESWQGNDYEWTMYEFAERITTLGEYKSAHAILKSIYDVIQDPVSLAESIYVSYMNQDLSHCETLVNRIVLSFRNQIKAVLGMSSKEKESYWNQMIWVKNTIGSYRNEIPIAKQLFDISLIYKNFLVNSEVTFLRTLEKTGDKIVKSQVKELRTIKDLLASPATHNYNLDSLKLREIEINRQIVQNLKNLSDFEYSSNICCDSLVRALAPNEVAIEISDYSAEDTKYYVAMILRKGFEEPILIELGEESRFASLSKMPVKKLYDPTLPFSTELYELIWTPITPYLNKSDVIYISPSGILSTLAIEALSSEDGIYVSEQYDIKRVTSTAYVLEQRGEYAYESSCIFGGVRYDSNVNAEYCTEEGTWDSGYLLDRSIYEDIPYLPGTKKEAELISEILTHSNGEVHLHVGADANEYVFKSLSSTSPEIIHIATHGFYIPREERISYRYYTETTSDLAMERSGLMLAGANDAWNGKLIPGIEDGILTASEIAELDLSRTNLVVMSACETGLGEITEDGIEGLQRAFKSAGVETLVMSLWKVDDKATELLMTEFYNLLLKGYEKDDAFQLAKKKVRSKKSYASPYYWASFIMLD